jgi:Glycosyltransferase family 28 C-terminal domain
VRSRRVELIFFDAGGGHRAAATALKDALELEAVPWEPVLLNLGELLAPLDIVRKVSGISLQDAYNRYLKSGRTFGAVPLLRAIQLLVRVYHRSLVERLEAHWRESQPHLVVSLVPNFNRALAESVERALGPVPFVTLLTDLADYPPHFWMERQPQYFICGTRRAVEQAGALGHAADRVLSTSGMILRRDFYEPIATPRAEGRERLGLRPDTPTGIVLLGGQGSTAIRQIATRLETAGLDLQLILVCGRNAALEADLRRRTWQVPVYVEGFTREIPRLMHFSDFLVGKPGPGSLSEAFAMGLPAVVELNAWTLPQERFNAEWVRDERLGVVIGSFRGVAGAVAELLREPETYRANVARIRNRAIFEIPSLLEGVLARSA